MINTIITLKYIEASNNIKKQIKIDEKGILKSKEALHQLERNGENNSFITLEDHKESSNNNPTVRLINVSKEIFT